MTTKRHPIRPPGRLRITPEVVAAFRTMESARLRCTCKEGDNAYSCPACRRWWRAHNVLHDGLGLPPWQYPAFAYPEECEREGRPERHDLYAVLVEAAK
jgi:hypothetical protein